VIEKFQKELYRTNTTSKLSSKSTKYKFWEHI